jgi:Spy/CpxP family protein refolding chaperone
VTRSVEKEAKKGPTNPHFERRKRMRTLFSMVAIAALVFCLSASAQCGEDRGENPSYGSGWGHHHMMGPGYGMHGSGCGEGSMMGPGVGMHGRGKGMHGWGRGMGPSSRGWETMNPEQRKKWEKMRSSFLQETLEERKQLAAKQVELQTLWDQPEVDQQKIDKLSEEVAELQAEISKKHNKYLMRCRQEFGDQGWACPGMNW